ncbi:MAG TPA: DUF3011 domain-containing protein [Candidatus Acidoferrum sp.]
MKTSASVALVSLLVFLAFSPFFGSSSAVSAMPLPQSAATIYCASEDGHRHYCNADVGNGIQLYRQHSQSPCRFRETWGYDERGIWVDRGCRADFVAGYGNDQNWGGFGEKFVVYCASDDGRRAVCPADTRGGIRLVRKRSDSSCVYGASWGYDNQGIWVDRGCRADFEIGQAGYQPEQGRTIYCASEDMHRNVCRANTGRGVRIIRQRSESDCIYGRTWGFDRGGIWVDRGCRADFAINEQRW